MTGKQLNILRRFNRITQKDLANLFGYSTPKIVQVLESEEFIPDKFAIILAEQCNLKSENVLDDEWLKAYIKKVPEKYTSRNNYNKYSIHNRNRVILNDLSRIK